MLDTPPEFGTRGTGEIWVEIGDDLTKSPGFVRDLTYAEGYARAEKLASSTHNEWRERIRAWGLFDAPYVVVGRARPELRKKLDHEREERVAAELARLEARFGTKDAQEVLRKRLAEIDAASDAIAKAEADVPLAPLAPDPPMTNDDGLAWKTTTKGGVPRVASTFEAMKSATVSLALRLDDVPDESLPWLAVLPSLASEVGVIRDGKPIPYDEVEERLQREVLGAAVHLGSDTYTGRVELQVTASGNDAAETKRALAWARDFLFTPDWRPENLPRIKDVVEDRLAQLHHTMETAEEHWVESVEEAYRRQDHAVLAHASSFLTRTHDAFALSWRFEGGADAKGVAPFLKSLGAAGKSLDRGALAKLAEALASEDAKAKIDPRVARWVRDGRALPKPAQSRVRKAGRDLGRFLGDLPDASLARDWAALCDEMAEGVARPPTEALASLTKTMAAIRHAPNARAWLVGASKHMEAIAPDLDGLVDALDPAAVPHVTRAPRRFVLERAKARGVALDSPFVALMNPSTANGSLVHTAPAVGYDETREDALAGYLATNVFSGGGTQSFYKRMWGAALAYSDYVFASPRLERMELYADRVGSLPALLRFGEAEVRRARADAKFVDYAVVPAFGSRVGSTFETRAGAMAVDLAEGRTPERVRAFRSRLLALRSRPGLAEEMGARYIASLGAVIPALAGSSPLPDGAVYFTTGPESQIDAYEKEIARTRGEATKVLRLWPRDFWDGAK
jgi:hypothetical protein